MKVTVRKHLRKRKNKVSTVVKHYRKTVENFKKEHGINTPIKVKPVPKSATNSEAHTDSVMEDGKPLEHSINIERDKVLENRSGEDKVLHHELGHVLEREKKVLSSKKGKKFIRTVRKTASHKKLKDKYLRDTEETFARAYAQKKVGPKKADVRTGENLSKKDFKKVKHLI